jgi:CBS domain-containing protein
MSSSEIGKMMVRDLSEDTHVVDLDTTISKVIGLLREWNTYQVFIQREDKVGTVSVRDILKVDNITTQKIESIITYVPKLAPSDRVERAADIMEKYRIRALPIVENRKITGQITAQSIVKAINHNELKNYKINSIMTREPLTLNTSDPATKARSIMMQKRIDHIPVVGDGKLVGIVTSSDIIYRIIPPEGVETGAVGASKQNQLDYSVTRLMDTDAVTCEVEEKISEVLEKIQKRRSTYAVGLLWSEVQGIVTYRDFLKLAVAKKDKLEVPMYIVGLPEDPFEAEATREKFRNTVLVLKKAFPEITEARSVIKTKEIRSDRRRYEVHITLNTPTEMHTYTEGGYDLPSIYDILVERMKRLLPQRSLRKKRPSQRHGEEGASP